MPENGGVRVNPGVGECECMNFQAHRVSTCFLGPTFYFGITGEETSEAVGRWELGDPGRTDGSLPNRGGGWHPTPRSDPGVGRGGCVSVSV
jgi:hypothetical protein